MAKRSGKAEQSKRKAKQSKGKTMKYSRQREEVMHAIEEHHDHPTADQIYAELRDQDPTISLATVYRNLKFLSEQGKIQKLSFIAGADHFDPNMERHSHFVCEHCGRIYDLPAQTEETLDEEAAPYAPGKITCHDLVFHGICEACEKSFG
jgi:Fur family peroxide stress response transcriptional regulator